ncbi:class I SAM-dependent methyltransferase [Nonomuraea sp. M3C6]|uniref:Class I SAM-dependent methyltransferase n=1 Tax=Nonomuraea marmarensis TaxID=3351344 RepID=A0ABW7AD27_9ACTN
MCAYGERLPLRSQSIAACMMILLIHQVAPEDRYSLLAESRRVLRPGGVLMVKTSSHRDLRRRTFVKFFPSGLEINLSRYPTIENLVETARAVGFDLLCLEPIHSSQVLPVADILHAIRSKHNSTLALLSKEEFDTGYASLERTVDAMSTFRIDHYHTIAKFRRKEISPGCATSFRGDRGVPSIRFSS